ncbi:protein of unknown function [Azospirillum baldaniorum]|uniref:Uncharacterized protein n=1 Tax=Azospirillum baldaniorum TaxID=1064539 RepID=A0A9P1JS18_9PROT|nr:protein of unknown function [Azospirillum baldaniorum]
MPGRRLGAAGGGADPPDRRPRRASGGLHHRGPGGGAAGRSRRRAAAAREPPSAGLRAGNPAQPAGPGDGPTPRGRASPPAAVRPEIRGGPARRGGAAARPAGVLPHVGRSRFRVSLGLACRTDADGQHPPLWIISASHRQKTGRRNPAPAAAKGTALGNGVGNGIALGPVFHIIGILLTILGLGMLVPGPGRCPPWATATGRPSSAPARRRWRSAAAWCWRRRARSTRASP